MINCCLQRLTAVITYFVQNFQSKFLQFVILCIKSRTIPSSNEIQIWYFAHIFIMIGVKKGSLRIFFMAYFLCYNCFKCVKNYDNFQKTQQSNYIKFKETLGPF